MFKLLKHLSVYLCFGLGLLIGCNNVNTVEGNFSVCFMSEYSEVYFKGDSLRMAAESEWIRRSSWKEFDLRGDTILFETFGEWTTPFQARLVFHSKNKMEFKALNWKTSNLPEQKLFLERIHEEVDIDSDSELVFWEPFFNRQDKCHCK